MLEGQLTSENFDFGSCAGPPKPGDVVIVSGEESEIEREREKFRGGRGEGGDYRGSGKPVVSVCGEDASAASSADTDAKGGGEDVEMLVAAGTGMPSADALSPRGPGAQRCS